MRTTGRKQGDNRETGHCRPPVAHRFQPGQSGNPAGRPKGRSVTAVLRKVIDANDGALAERLVRTLVDRALKGDFRAMREIWDRMEGKPTRTTEISGPSGGPIVSVQTSTGHIMADLVSLAEELGAPQHLLEQTAHIDAGAAIQADGD